MHAKALLRLMDEVQSLALPACLGLSPQRSPTAGLAPQLAVAGPNFSLLGDEEEQEEEEEEVGLSSKRGAGGGVATSAAVASTVAPPAASSPAAQGPADLIDLDAVVDVPPLPAAGGQLEGLEGK